MTPDTGCGSRDAGSFPRQLKWAGVTLGFALGGFFDGILLHQILQWHHLLSALEGTAFQDIRIQIIADGLFHALMYVVSCVGLWMLWRSRHGFSVAGADWLVAAWGLIGFGVWHVIDGVLSHWILGIHRIRMDVDNRLFWDLLWIVVFGVAFIAAGWLVRRGANGGGGSGATRRRVTPAALTIAVLFAGTVAALPPADLSTVLVVFKPGTTAQEVFAALQAADARLVWNDASQTIWAIDLGMEGDAVQLYRHGALLVSNGLLPTGCLDWTRV